MPDELWNEVRDIVQETVIETIPKRKKCKKANWLSEEALQIAVERREMKSKGEKERYKHLNAEFQRIARRYKRAFLSDQCKEIEENNRMGKTRDLFKKLEIPGNDNPVYETAKETQMYRTVFWTLWEKARVGRFGRMALKHVLYHIRNESPVQV